MSLLFKRVLSLVLALAMTLSMAPASTLSTLADEVEESYDKTVSNQGTTLTHNKLITQFAFEDLRFIHYEQKVAGSYGLILKGGDLQSEQIIYAGSSDNTITLTPGKVYTAYYYYYYWGKWKTNSFTFKFEPYYNVTVNVTGLDSNQVSNGGLSITVNGNKTELANGKEQEKIPYGATVSYEAIVVPGYDAKITASGTKDEGTITYTVAYTMIDYTIIFDHGTNGTWATTEGYTVNDDDKIVFTKNYGNTLTAPDVKAKDGWTFIGWEPVIDTVKGNATYVAQYSQDTYKKYVINDGTGIVKEFNVNVTKEETFEQSDMTFIHKDKDGKELGSYTFVDATDNDKLFKEWDIVTSEDGKTITYTALWYDDKNNNDIDDNAEKITVIIDENGNVTIDGVVGKNNIAAVYDSTKGTVTVVAYPNEGYYVDVTAADSNGKNVELTGTWENKALYNLPIVGNNNPFEINGNRNVYTGTFAVEPGTSYTVTVQNTEYKLELPKDEVTVEVNGYISANLKLDKEAILNEIFGETEYNADDYTVIPKGTSGWGVQVPGAGTYTVTKAATEKYPEVSTVVTINWLESRQDADIKCGYETGSFDTEADFINAVKNRVTVKDVDGNDVPEKNSFGISNINMTVEKQDDRTYTLTVTVKDNQYTLATTKTFEGLTWNVNQYKVTFKNWNGDILSEKSYDYGTAADQITLPNDPDRTGYHFTGWEPSVDKVTGDVTYTAQFEVNKHNIYYYVDGELYHTIKDEAYGKELSLIADPTKEGHTFSGWSGLPATMPDENVNVYGTFAVNTYTITWIWKNADGDQKTEVELPYGSAITVPTEIAKSYQKGNVTYTLTGWTGLTDRPTVPANDVTYTANYTTMTAYIVSFDSDGGSTVIDQTIIVENNDVVVKPANPIREGYRFLGWYLNGEEYVFGNTIDHDITLVAKWVKLVTVSFDVDGIEDQIIDINTTAKEPTAPTKQDFVFVGWYLNGEKFDFSKPVTDDIKLTAKWEADSNNNGVIDEEETIIINVTGNGTVTIDGKTYADGDKLVYDSTKTVTLSLKAAPVVTNESLKYHSSSFVSAIRVDNAAQTLSYGTAYVVELSVNANGVKAISVDFEDAKFVNNEDGILSYYVGKTGVTNEDVYNAAVLSPAYGDATELTLKYLAREATTAKVSLSSLDVNSTLKTILENIGFNEFTFNLDDLWLDVNVEDMSALIEDSVSLDQAVSEYLTKDRINGLYDIYMDAANANGGWFFGASAGIAAVEAEIQKIYNAIYDAAMYYGAHNFGYNPTDAETVDETIYITYKCEAYYIEEQTTVTLKDTRENSYLIGNENTELIYRDYLDEDLIDLIGIKVTDKDGNVIDGAIVSSVAIMDPYTFEDKNVSETAYEIVFKFAGNETYKPSEATYYITIVKADASIDLPNVMVTYGKEYTTDPEVILGNAYGIESELTDSLIYFVLGLDVADLEITEDGVDGVATTIQLMLPADYMKILETLGLKDGITLSLSKLNEYLESLGDLITAVDSSNDVVSTLINALKSLSELVELPNVDVTIGGQMPTDIGVYLYGAISTSGNYETAFDVGYIVILPDATEVELEWNHKDSNGIFTPTLLQYVDLGAHASDSAADELIKTLFFGVDEEGNMVLTWDQSTLGNGAYTELAFIAEWGNEFYYAVPIFRAFVIVPNQIKVDIIVDGNNKNNNTTIFDNESVDVKLDYNTGDLVIKDSWNVTTTLNFYGVQTNGKIYNSDKAPVHAGAYIATATVTVRDENGELLAFGADVTTIVIKPASADIEVTDKIEVVGGEHDPADQITVSTGSGVKPDTTVIVGSIGSNGTFSENGMSALVGNLNIDFPKWVDEIIAKYAPSVVDGITVKEFSEKVVNKLPKLAQILEEKGINASVIDALTESIEKVAALLADVPENVTLSFKDNYTVSNVGVYVIIGVVTDSDHIPAIDAGYLIITPDVTKVELKWNHEDENGIWTRDLLDVDGVDLWASAFENGILNADATAKITYQFIGVNSKGEPVIYTDPDKLPNGAYIEVAYIELVVDGEMVVSDIIARPVVIVASSCNVKFDNVDTIYNGQQQGVGEITVTDNNGNVINTENGKLNVIYVGVTTKGEAYKSTEKPVDAGVYSIIVIYIEYVDGEVRYYGGNVGQLTIRKAESQLEIKDTTVTWDGKEHFATVNNPNNLDYLTAILNRENNTINFILENDTKALLAWIEEKLDITIADSYNVGALITQVHDWIKCLNEIAQVVDVAEAIEVLNALDELLSKLPHEGIVYINGAYPTEIGTYECYIASYSYNYLATVAMAELKIVPIRIKVDVENNSKYFGNEDPNPVYNVSYYDHLGNKLEGFDTDVVVSISRQNGEDVGKYLYIVTASVADKHYEIASVSNDAYLEIKPAEITIIVNDNEKTYGENDPEIGYVFNVVNGNVTAEQIGLNITRQEGENVGDYDYIVNYTKSENWIVTVESVGKLSIKPAKLTITVNGASKYYGDDDPDLTWTVNGLVNGDFESILNIVASRLEGEHEGKYTITATYTSGNYEVTVVSGTFTINPAEVQITINGQTMTNDKDSQIPELTYKIDMIHGKVTKEELGLNLTVEVKRGENGQIIVGSYKINASYNDPVNPNDWDVTINEAYLNVKLGDYVCWNVKTGVYYSDLSDALEAVDDEDEETIQMLKNYEEKYVIIAPGTTLDLSHYTVKATFVVGLPGSFLTGDTYSTSNAYGQLIVAEKNLSLSEEAYFDGSYYRLPVYNKDRYVFSRFEVDTNNSDRGLSIEGDNLRFQFVTNMTYDVMKKLLIDGADDNALSVKVRLEWMNEAGTAYLDFDFKDSLIGDMCTGRYDLLLTLSGLETMGVNLSTLKVYGVIESSSGATVYGDVWTIPAE